MFIIKYVYRIPMGVIHVWFDISLEGAPIIRQRGEGATSPPPSYA